MTINVPMEVTRARQVGEMVQVWGYVGDYEVCVYVPLGDPRAVAVLPPAKKAKAAIAFLDSISKSAEEINANAK